MHKHSEAPVGGYRAILMKAKKPRARKRHYRPPPGQAVFRAPRWKPMLLALGSLGGETVGILMLLTGISLGPLGPLGAWLVVGVFSVVLVALFERILWPAVIELTSRGFQVRGPRQTTVVAWDNLDDPAVVRTGRSWMVAYKLRQSPNPTEQDPRQQLLAKIDAAFSLRINF